MTVSKAVEGDPSRGFFASLRNFASWRETRLQVLRNLEFTFRAKTQSSAKSRRTIDLRRAAELWFKSLDDLLNQFV